jgi:hypothetical protein
MGRAPTAALDLRQQLVGVWKIESIYTETRTGGQRKSYGERPNGYGVLTREMRAMVIITAENRKAPATDADNRAAFQSMISYSGIYRVENAGSSLKLILPGMRRGLARNRSGSSNWRATP